MEFLTLCCSLSLPPAGYGEVLYTQPQSVPIAGHVFVNPSPWKGTNQTCAVMWQRGHMDARIKTPTNANVGRWTGLTPSSPAEQAESIHSSSGPYPWSAVQYTTDGAWGAALNTTGCDNSKEHLSTTTLEAQFDSCADVWGQAGEAGALQVELDLAVPHAFKLSGSNNSCAVYISFSIYLQTKRPPAHFIWYSTDFFDLERDCTKDHVFIDLSSHKLIISSHVTGRSAYNAKLPGSALSANSTFAAPRRIGYQITAANVEQGIRDGLARFAPHFPQGLPGNASDWCVPGFNIELEATPNAGAGMSMRNLHIARAASL